MPAFILNTFYILLPIVILVSVAMLARFMYARWTHRSTGFEQKLYLCLLPKERFKGDERKETDTAEQVRQQISTAEQVLNAIGGLSVKGAGWLGLKQRADQVALEIVSHQGRTSFYISIPLKLDTYFQENLRSNYPDLELREAEDYNIFPKYGGIRATYLKLSKPSYLPIKTYRQMEQDPLESLLGALSKLPPTQAVGIQIVARSAHKKWHQAGLSAIAKIKRGEGLVSAAGPSLIGTIGKTLLSGVKSEKNKLAEADKPTRLSPREEELAKLIEDKNAKAGLEVNLRVVTVAEELTQANFLLENILNTFNQYSIYEYGNSFKPSKEGINTLVREYIYRVFHEKKSFVLNTEELASLWHLPLTSSSAPNIIWLSSRRAAAPVRLPTQGVLLGENIYRDTIRPVRLQDDDRRRHTYVIGTTGTGKTTLLKNMAKQDIDRGAGVGVIDPHGDFVEYLLSVIPKNRIDDVVLFEPSNTAFPIGLNMLEAKAEQEKDFATQEMIAIFYKLVPNPEMIGPMFEHNMRNAMLTLMANAQNPGTIAEIPRIFTDPDFQQVLLKNVTDPVVRAFWEKEMAKTSDFHKSEMLGYLISKVGRFVENSMMRNIIGQARSGINFKQVIRDGKILLVNLSKGLVGEINSSLLGLIIVSKLQMAAFSNAELPEDERRDFYLYIDEFQNYTTDSIATILSEARKYRLNLIMAHQYLGQLVKNNDTSIKNSVLGNVGNMLAFRIGVEDAPTIADTMAPVFGEYDLVNLERYNAYAKIMIDGTVQRAFSLQTIAPEPGDIEQARQLKELSSTKYGRPRAEVELEILKRSKLGEAVKRAETGEVEKSL